MKRITTIFLATIDFINEWCGRTVAFLVLVQMVLVTLDVFARYLLNRPTIWVMEACQICLLAMTCLGVGFTLLHGGHAKVTLLYDILSPKTRVIVDLVVYSLALFVSVVLVWYGTEIFWQNLIFGFTSGSAWNPLQWPTKILVPIAGGLLGLQVLAIMIRALIFGWTGKMLKSKMASGDI